MAHSARHHRRRAKVGKQRLYLAVASLCMLSPGQGHSWRQRVPLSCSPLRTWEGEPHRDTASPAGTQEQCLTKRIPGQQPVASRDQPEGRPMGPNTLPVSPSQTHRRGAQGGLEGKSGRLIIYKQPRGQRASIAGDGAPRVG